MKIARRDYMPLCVVLSSTYLFLWLFMLKPSLASSGWISCITGYALALPIMFACRALFADGRDLKTEFEGALSVWAARIWYVVAALFLLFEAHNVTMVYTSTVLAYADNLMHEKSIAIMIVLITGLVAQLGSVAVTGAARITLRVSATVALIAAAASISKYRPSYLTPVLGPGIAPLAEAVPPLSGILALPLLYLFMVDTREDGMNATMQTSVLAALGWGTGVLLLYAMVMPTLPGIPDSIDFRTNALLNDGLTDIQIQLPILFIWNACVLKSISALMLLCAQFLSFAIKRLDGYCGIIVTLTLAVLVYFCSLNQSLLNICDAARWPIIAAPLIAAAVIAAIKRGNAKRKGGVPG